MKIASSGRLGDLRIFSSTFTQRVVADNVRLQEPESRGGGSVYDMGVYCINAARYLFRDEPKEVVAVSASTGDGRFRESAEMTTVVLRFPKERIAVFTSSFGAAKMSEYSLLGTRGSLRVSPAYDYSIPLAYELRVGGGRPKHKKFPKHDQFGAEMEYFSDCILRNREPEPSGEEGLADVRIVRAILESARASKPVKLGYFERKRRPDRRQEIDKRAVQRPELVDVGSPSGR
jgi:glucose-fructose oxidoreductase